LACDSLLKSPSKLNDCNNDTGLTLNGIDDWSSEWSFVDLMLTGRAWISQNFNTYTWSTGTTQTNYIQLHWLSG
jgi:hypothetical protein